MAHAKQLLYCAGCCALSLGVWFDAGGSIWLGAVGDWYGYNYNSHYIG